MSIGAHNLQPPAGAVRRRKRVGRGDGSGHGTYSGRGLKGQKSRSGKTLPYPSFEGGQIPASRKFARLRGFNNKWRIPFQPVNVSELERFDDGAEVTPEALREAGVLKHLRLPVKILGEGELSRKLTVSAHGFSESAKAKIEGAGGTVATLEYSREARPRS